MRAVNHTITGAVIGATVSEPALALPAAFLSHFVLDMLPHHGDKDHLSLKFKLGLLVDAALSLAFLLAVLLLQLDDWPLLIACGILGAAPDLLWFPYWLWEVRGKPRKFGPVLRLLERIQWCERPWGIYIEAVWFVGALYLFFRLTV